MADRETIRRIVNEELARPEVERSLSERLAATQSERIAQALRHPLAITLAGFVLTFLFGSIIENRLAESRKAAAARETQIERIYEREAKAQEVVIEFVRLVHWRAVESSLLRSAINRRSTPELLDRKAAYDEAYRPWNQREPEYRIALRQVWAGSDRSKLADISPYELAVGQYIDIHFGNADACLTRHFDLAVNLVYPDENFTNTPGGYCDRTDWTQVVSQRERAARECAVYIRAVSLDVLRQRTDAEVTQVLLGNEAPKVEVNVDAIKTRLAEACDIPGTI